MKTVTEKKGAANGIRALIMPVLTGILSGFLVSIVLLAIFSLIMTAKDLPSGTILWFACISIAGGSMSGGFVTARLCRNKGLFYGVITGFIYFLILYLTGFFMKEANLNAVILIKLVISVLFGGIGGIMGVNMHHKRSKI